MAQHEGGFGARRVSRGLAGGDLNLGNRRPGVEFHDQHGERPEQLRQWRGEHLAVVHHGDEPAALFAESHKHPALAPHEPHREPRLAAVIPLRAGQRRQQVIGIRLDTTGFGQLRNEPRLFVAQLECAGHILVFASAANAEHRAAGRNRSVRQSPRWLNGGGSGLRVRLHWRKPRWTGSGRRGRK